MKNFYTSVFLVFVLTFTTNAQTIFYDDFESYVGGVIPTCEIWSAWNGDPNNGSGIIVVDDIAIDNQSGYIGPGSVQDVLMVLGNQTSEDYTVQWEMYITAGSTGYFNIQGMTETNATTGCQEASASGGGSFNSSNLYFNNSGAAPGVFEDQTTGETGTYPEDAWFTVSIYFDLTVSTPTYIITIDGGVVNANPVPFQADTTLGAIDFFSIDANNNFWLDDVLFTGGTLGIEDNFTANNFSVSPNPVKDVLNIRSTNTVDMIQVYDLLGKLVLETTPEIISPSLNMSELSSGIYLVKVTIGDVSKTVKIIK